MTSVKIVLALIVTVLIGAGVFVGVQHFVEPQSPVAGAVSGQLAENYDPYLRNNGGYNSALPIQTSSTLTALGNFTASAVSILNAVVFGIGANGASSELTVSGANGASFTMTAAQFCNLTAIVVPSSNTTTQTIVFPSQASTAALCGGLPAGAFAFAFIDNESTSNVNLSTTTGSNLSFMVATGSAAFMSTYPPKVPAQTIVEAISFATSSSADVMMLKAFLPGTNF